LRKQSGFGALLLGVARGRWPDDFDMRLPTPRALQLEDGLPGLDLIDEIAQPSVAAAAPKLDLR
jgi:hypothetical protein